jgi:hypothetical protein
LLGNKKARRNRYVYQMSVISIRTGSVGIGSSCSCSLVQAVEGVSHSNNNVV